MHKIYGQTWNHGTEKGLPVPRSIECYLDSHPHKLLAENQEYKKINAYLSFVMLHKKESLIWGYKFTQESGQKGIQYLKA
jgi:hypothetical protein